MKATPLVGVLFLGCGFSVSETEARLVSSECEAANDAVFPEKAMGFQLPLGGLSKNSEGNFYLYKRPNLGKGPSPDGQCSVQFASRWRDAMHCAVSRAQNCLPSLNWDLSQRISSLVGESSKQRAILIACSVPLDECGGNLAITSPERRGKWAHMALDEEGLMQKDDEYLCNAALHEIAHWAGESGELIPTACGQYCGGRCMRGPGGGMQDCLECAGEQYEKGECGGGVEVFTDGPPATVDPDNNRCGTQGYCTTLRYARFIACDNTWLPNPFSPQDWPGIPQCCEVCSDYPAQTCEDDPALPVGLYPCDLPAPECRR